MKKTLFLSAILATALCSSAFGAEYTVNTANNGVIYTATADDTITFDLAGTSQNKLYLANPENQPAIAAKIIVTHLTLTDAHDSKTFTFNGAVSGTGEWCFAGVTNASNQNYIFNGDMSEYSGDMSIADNKSGSFTFNNNTTGTGSISGANVTLNLNAASSVASSVNVKKVSVSGDNATVSMKNVTTGTLSFSGNTTQLELSGTNEVTDLLDLSNSTNFAGKLVLKSGATLTHASNMNFWMRAASEGILLEENATFTKGNLTVRGRSGANGQIHQLSGSAIYSMGSNAYEIKNANVTVGGTDETLGNLLTNVNLAKSHAGTLTLSADGNTINGFTFGNGITLNFTGSTASVNGNVGMRTNGTLKVSGTNSAVTVKAFDALADVNTNIVLGKNSTLTLQDGASTWLKNTTLNVKHDTDGTGGTLSLGNILFGYTGGSASTLNVESGTTVKVTGGADGTSGKGFIIWNGEAHTFNVDGTLAILAGMSVNSANSVFNIAKTGVLQLNNGITFVGCNKNTPASLGTINVKGDNAVGGTLAIGGQTTGNKATVNLYDGSKVVAIDAATSTEQVFTLNNQATVTFSGKGLDGTANNTLTVNSNISKSTAAVNSIGTVNFGDMNVVRLEVTGTSTVGTLETPKVIMHEDSSLTVAGADTNITSLTLGSGATVTLGSAASHNHDLTTTTLTVAGNSTINANLVVNDNGLMDFSNHTELTMGCTVTIGDQVTIKIDDSELASIVSGNSVMTIIKDVEGVDMGNLALTLGSGWKFVDAQGNSLDAYNLRLDVVDAGDGKVNIVVAPEPATATLSLLALVGLAARRRRR